MIAALIRKELRDLLPWGVLCLVLGALDVVPELLRQIDMRPLGSTMAEYLQNTAIIDWMLAFAIATGLTTREQDDRTLAFLDGLPVSRGSVFLVKSGVMVLMVLLAPLMSFLVILCEHFLSSGSLDHELRPLLLLQLMGVQLLLICNGAALGAALGWLRGLTWLTIGCLVVALQYFSREFPILAMLNPLSLVERPFNSTGLAIDAQTAWFHAALAAVAWGIAWYAFSRAGRARTAFVAPRPLVGALVTIATVVVMGVALSLAIKDEVESMAEQDNPQNDAPRFAASPPAQTNTRHYEFSYPAQRSAATLRLANQADAIFERVHALLGVPPGDAIAVDVSGSMPNTAGTAFFGRIRMEVDEEPVIVLAHETAHVVARRIAGNTAAALWTQTNLLDEGLASWVDSHFGVSQLRAGGLFILAAMHVRRELLAEELFDEARLAELRDPVLKYPAGEALINATVRLYGEPALLRLLRAFADPRLPKDLSGEALWQATFQLAGMDIGAVVDEFYREVAAYAKRHTAEIAALPRVRVRLVKYEDAIGVEPLLDSEDGAEVQLRLRFKPDPNSSFDLVENIAAEPFEPVFRDTSEIAGGQICVQPGVKKGSQVLFEPWVCLPTSDATELAPQEDAAPGADESAPTAD